MERFKRSFSFRKKKDHVPESHKPHQWQEDERKVRDGTCSFQVRYLGCIEVFESRGIQVCEEAVKALKSSKGKYQRAILYVSGDALRVVDEISKGLIVDQTIEKVSFCAPDRSHEKGFAYICRDGTTRRWMCHGFLAIKETVSGERLSHAVGCAFAICLERKQKREKESVTVTFNDKGTSFTRTGSFRQTTLTERLADPQSAIIAEPVPLKTPENPHAVQRPHASADMLQRQSSFRGFQKLESSPFKRQLSLRLSDLPSTIDRQQQFGQTNLANGSTVATIPEASPTREREEESLSEMCQQVTQGLTALTSDDPFASAPNSSALLAATQKQNASALHNIPESTPAAQDTTNNPWGQPTFVAGHARNMSEAENWLNTATSHVKDPFSTTSTVTTVNRVTLGSSTTTNSASAMNGVVQPNLQPVVQPTVVPIQQRSPWANDNQFNQNSLAQRNPHLGQARSHSVDTAELAPHPRAPTLRELSSKDQFSSQAHNAAQWSTSVGGFGQTTSTTQPFAGAGLKQDPFDAAWAARAPASNTSTNPFQAAGDATITKTFEVNL